MALKDFGFFLVDVIAIHDPAGLRKMGFLPEIFYFQGTFLNVDAVDRGGV